LHKKEGNIILEQCVQELQAQMLECNYLNDQTYLVHKKQLKDRTIKKIIEYLSLLNKNMEKT